MLHRLTTFFLLAASLSVIAETGDLNVPAAQAKYDAQRAIADRAKARMEERERDYRRVEGEYFDAVGREKQAQATLDAAQRRLSELNSTISSYESDLVRIQSTIDDYDRQQRRLESEVRDRRHDLADVDRELFLEKSKPTPDAAKVAQLESRHENLESQIRDLERRIDRIQDDIADARRQYSQKQNELAQANRDRQQQLFVINDCQDEVRRAGDFVRLCQSRLSEAKSTFIFAQSEFQQEDRLAQQAYAYLQAVIANYNRERDKVVAAATAAGNRDGGREAQERAPAPGTSEGKAFAAAKGFEVGSAEGRARDRAQGYREGREKGDQIPEVAAYYEKGFKSGREWADSKAAKEDLPRGYNLALTALLSNEPARKITLDISETSPGDAGGGGVELSAKPKVVGSVAEPAYVMPGTPAYAVPAVGTVSVTVPTRDNRYFSAPCQVVILPEFGPLCAKVYDDSYASGYQSVYRSVYSQSFAAAFGENIKAAYDAALALVNAQELREGLAQGALDRGVLVGYAKRLPDAVAEQFAAGEEAFRAQMLTGYLPIVRSLDLVDTNGDGLFTPGETAKLRLVLDNYGGQATPNAQFKARITKLVGLEGVTTSLRDLPAIAAETRATIDGVVGARVAVLPAKQKIRIEGVVEGGSLAFGFAVEKEVHFPIELEAVTLSKKAKIGETVSATFRYRNLTKERSVESKVTLSAKPAVVAITSDKLMVPAIEPGQTVDVTAPLKPGMWVGENTDVPFYSEMEKFTQPFWQGLSLDRDGALLLFDTQGLPIPTSTLVVAAGSVVSFQAQFKYLRNYNLNGPFYVQASSTSQPTITAASGSTTGVNYGAFGPGSTASKIRFSYNVPKSLAGKKEWVMVTLYNNGAVLHALQVYLDVR